MRCGVELWTGLISNGDGLSLVVGGTGVPRLTEHEHKSLSLVEFVSTDRFQIGFLRSSGGGSFIRDI